MVISFCAPETDSNLEFGQQKRPCFCSKKHSVLHGALLIEAWTKASASSKKLSKLSQLFWTKQTLCKLFSKSALSEDQ